ncbi:MAG: DUF554 domain-containing protein [Clostridia bacterium]|nr:DUF554 domain-containing protein [Clostridia bacterium]
MLGVLVNTVAVILGSTVGLLFKKAIPQKISGGVMIALALCTLYIGVDGMLNGANVLLVIAAMVFGAVVGFLLNIDGGIEALGRLVERRFPNSESGAVARGFVTASLLFCVGAMTVVGSLNAGISGDNTLLFTKSLLDLCSSAMLAASLGVGVLFSAAFVLVFQGMLVLLAQVLQPLLTDGAIGAMTCVGSLMIVALGLNLLGATKVKVSNYLPALVFAPLLWWLFSLPVFGGFFG